MRNIEQVEKSEDFKGKADVVSRRSNFPKVIF